MSKSLVPKLLVIGGGAALFGAGSWWAFRRAGATSRAVEQAVANGGTFLARTTGYWPYKEGMTAKERLMEGIPFDRKAPAICKTNPNDPSCKVHAIHTLEQHLADPVAHPFVSVSGDDAIFPYGQRLVISAWPNAVFRVVDTGGHFRGIQKVYRIVGLEPLDVAVNSPTTFVPKTAVSVRIVAGDNFEHGKAVATGGMKGQTVAGEVIVDAHTTEDIEALARAIESNLGGRSVEEQNAAAWAIRNRADADEISVHALLAPRGQYGAAAKSGGFASTRKVPTERSREVAAAVLDSAPSGDPTGGATDYWVPEQQAQMYQCGDVHRAAKKSGDEVKAKRYEKFAGFGSEGDARVKISRDGFRTISVIGAVELLKRT